MKWLVALVGFSFFSLGFCSGTLFVLINMPQEREKQVVINVESMPYFIKALEQNLGSDNYFIQSFAASELFKMSTINGQLKEVSTIEPAISAAFEKAAEIDDPIQMKVLGKTLEAIHSQERRTSLKD